MIVMFIILSTVMVSGVYEHVQTYQILYLMCSLLCIDYASIKQLKLNKLAMHCCSFGMEIIFSCLNLAKNPTLVAFWQAGDV